MRFPWRALSLKQCPSKMTMSPKQSGLKGHRFLCSHHEEDYATNDLDKAKSMAYHYREILKLLGEDPNRKGLLKTPMRAAKAMQFYKFRD